MEKETYSKLVTDIETALAPQGLSVFQVEVSGPLVTIKAIASKTPDFLQRPHQPPMDG